MVGGKNYKDKETWRCDRGGLREGAVCALSMLICDYVTRALQVEQVDIKHSFQIFAQGIEMKWHGLVLKWERQGNRQDTKHDTTHRATRFTGRIKQETLLLFRGRKRRGWCMLIVMEILSKEGSPGRLQEDWQRAQHEHWQWDLKNNMDITLVPPSPAILNKGYSRPQWY